MNIKAKCVKCQEPTKRIVGVWDGKNGSHVALYACGNDECEIRAFEKIFEEEARKRVSDVQAENDRNNIAPKTIRAIYRARGLTLIDAARLFGMTPSKLSGYINEREAVPVEVYIDILQKINAYKKVEEQGNE